MGATFALPEARDVGSPVTLPSCSECHPELYAPKKNFPHDPDIVADAATDTGIWGRCPGVNGEVPSGFVETLMEAVDKGRLCLAEKLLEEHSEWLQGPLAFDGDAACLHVLQVLFLRREPQQLVLLRRILTHNSLVDQLWPKSNWRSVETKEAVGAAVASKATQWGFRHLALRPSAIKGQRSSAVAGPSECWAKRTAASLLRGIRIREPANVSCSEQQKKTLRQLREQPLLSVGEVAILFTQDEDVHKVVAETTQQPSVLLVAAIANSSASVVYTLLQRGANPVNIRHGHSPLNLSAGAFLSPYEKSLLLLSHGSPPEPPLSSQAADKIVSVKAAKAAARFALGWVSNQREPTREGDVFFPSKEAIEQSAKSLGAPVLVQQSSDSPALLQATARGDVKLMRLLLEHGASPNVFMFGVGLPTPLFHAVYWGLKAAVRLLLAYGANPFICKENGESVEDTARRMLDFSLLSKPKHIARLPLPKSQPEVCKYILGLIENAQRRWARAAVSVAVAGPSASSAMSHFSDTLSSVLLAERRPLLCTSWESLVAEPALKTSDRSAVAQRDCSSSHSSDINECDLDRLPSVDLQSFLSKTVPLLQPHLEGIRRLPSVSDLFDGAVHSCVTHIVAPGEICFLK